MKLQSINHYEITVTLSTGDCEALAKATKHASWLGDDTGAYDHGVAWNTQEEAAQLENYLEALSCVFELAAKYARDTEELRDKLGRAEYKTKRPNRLDYEQLQQMKPQERDVLSVVLAGMKRMEEDEPADNSRIIEEFEL